MQVARAVEADAALEFGPGVRIGIGGAVHDEGRGRAALSQPRPPGAVKQDAPAATAQGSRLGQKLQLIAFEQRIGQRFEQTPGFRERRVRVRDALRCSGTDKVPGAARRVAIDGVRVFGVWILCVRVFGVWILRQEGLVDQRILAPREIEPRHGSRHGDGLHAARIDSAGQGRDLVRAPVRKPRLDGVAVVLGIAQRGQWIPEFGAQTGLVILNEDEYFREIPAFSFKVLKFKRRQLELREALGRFIRARPSR